ncbi:hypothetical protein SDC9_210494 [bioreactor metagenome]|uniref:Uncharacterized protein n=1 Tax=bioreactor metagenome TaxID=1076179 RepID=A0A645JGK0_9ZZZZ
MVAAIHSYLHGVINEIEDHGFLKRSRHVSWDDGLSPLSRAVEIIQNRRLDAGK